MGNQSIQVTDSYVYLGITFTPSGSFSLAQKKLYNKATRSLYSFLSEVNIYNGASVSTVLKVTRPSFFGGYHPTLKLSGIPTFTSIVSLTHRMDNI